MRRPEGIDEGTWADLQGDVAEAAGMFDDPERDAREAQVDAELGPPSRFDQVAGQRVWHGIVIDESAGDRVVVVLDGDVVPRALLGRRVQVVIE